MVALAILAGAFVRGIEISAEFLRAPLERALTAAFGMPARIEGPLRVRTGLVATVSGERLVLADSSDPADAPFARAEQVTARIDLVALARRAVALEAVTAERLMLRLDRDAGGRGNWAPIVTRSAYGTPSPIVFAGIARLHVATLEGVYRAGIEPLRFAITDLDGALPASAPTTMRGTAALAGRTIAFDLRTSSLDELQPTTVPLPVQGTLRYGGARLALNGTITPGGPSLDAAVEVSAPDADALLATFGIASRGAGALAARWRTRITGADVSVADFVATLGESSATGSGRFSSAGERVRVELDAVAERLDLRPFLGAMRPAPGAKPLESAIEVLERLALEVDATASLSAAEVVELVTTLREARVEWRSAGGVVAARGSGIVAGTRARVSFTFDATRPKRVLNASLESGKLSSAELPRAARQTELGGTVGSLRGRLAAQGTTPRDVAASTRGSIEARDVRWTIAGKRDRPLDGRFDLARFSMQGSSAAGLELSGRLGRTPCALRVSGAGLAPLFDGERWPLKLAGSCRDARLDAQGWVTLGSDGVAADVAFDASAKRTGPIAELLDLDPDTPIAAAVRGTLAVGEGTARAKLGAVRIGRTNGSGEVFLPIAGVSVPRVRLALTNLDFDELATLGSRKASPPSDPLGRAVLPVKVRLPDHEFDFSAAKAVIYGEPLQRVHASGAVRDGRLPPTRVEFQWRGAQVNTEAEADFRSERPSIGLSATAENADLGSLLAPLGLAAIGLRAGKVSLRVSSAGAELGDLLAGATIDATIAEGRLVSSEQLAPGVSGRADLHATLNAAPGTATTLAAHGTMDGESFDLSVDTPGLAGLARVGAPVPATLRLSLGEARFQASGRIARGGTGEGKVRLEGERFDRLGRFIGVSLPEAGRYAASADLVVTTDSIGVSNLDATWGASRVLGSVQTRRGTRPSYLARLRAPALHLEDVGAARWVAARGPSNGPGTAGAPSSEDALAHALDLVRAIDIDASLEIDSLRGGTEHFVSGSARASMKGGALRVLVHDARTLSGAVEADVRLDATGAQPRVAVRAQITDLDYGPLARALDPTSAMTGRMDVVLDLAATGPLHNLLPALGGKVDLAVYPREMRAGAIDLWGSGLLQTLLRTLEPSGRSTVECGVAGVDIEGGVARTQAFFVDTTNVRIVGELDANLRTRALSGRLSPQSKRPELVTVATTLLVGGTIEEPRVSVAPANIVLAPLRFATPIAGFAREWLSARGALATGVPACREAFERARAAHAGK